MAAPAVEAAPIAGLLGVSLLAICAWLTLVGLSKGYDYTLGAAFRLFSQVLTIHVLGRAIHLGGPFDALDHRIRDAMAAGIDGLEYSIGRMFHGLDYLVTLQWNALATFAHDVEAAFTGLTHAEIPQKVVHITRQYVRKASADAGAATVRIRRVEHTVYRGIDELRHDFARAWQQALRGIDDLRGILAHDVIPAIRGLDHSVAELDHYTRRALARRVRHLEVAALGSTIVGVALYTLTRYFPWWQCTNVRELNRAACRLPVGDVAGYVELFLQGAILLDLATYVRLMQATTPQVAGGMIDILRVTEE